MAKILLAEDEVNIASFIERGLKEFRQSVMTEIRVGESFRKNLSTL